MWSFLTRDSEDGTESVTDALCVLAGEKRAAGLAPHTLELTLPVPLGLLKSGNVNESKTG